VWTRAKAALVGILETDHDTHDQDLASGINNCLARDGQNAATGDINAGSHKVINVATCTGNLDAGNKAYIDAGDAAVTEVVVAGYQPLNAALTAVSATGQPGYGTIPTGAMIDHLGSAAPDGWVLASGLTLGNGASAATGRANADTAALFALLWNAYADSILAVSSGRGASAAADYAANKRITIPDLRGRIAAGADNMGGTAASRLTSTTVDGTVLGASGGEQTHALSIAELAVHTHAITDPGHVHPYTEPLQGGSPTGSGASRIEVAQINNTASATTGITINNAGSGTAHNNVQPTWITNKIIKL
jgi:microcystin-dependent protein